MSVRIWKLVTLRGAALMFAVVAALRAQEAPLQVQLPPMLVEESTKLPPWLYARTEEGEFLSRCSERVTRGYVETRRARLQLLHWLVPREFFRRTDVPAVTILYSQRLKNSAAEELMKEVMNSRSREGIGAARSNAVATAVPNMMLDDGELVGVFAYADEAAFDRNRLSIATDFVRFALDKRVPALPTWLREGIVGLYAEADFVDAPITLPPLTWLSRLESSKLAGQPERPRMLLTAAELFAENTWREEARRSERGETLWAQSRLFVRWAWDPKHGVRDAFWRFAARAAEEPATEAMFEAAFGFGYSDLRDRLSDYLAEAVKQPLRLEAVGQPKLSPVEVRLATPGEVARLRGEWERLAFRFVRSRFPEVAERYVEQARRTLHRAYEAGEREARLFAALGLCEVDAGGAGAGREFLERAAAEGVVRPRVHLELARLQARELRGRGERWSAEEAAPLLASLRSAVRQTPPLAEAWGLLADVWAGCEGAIGEQDRVSLEAGAALWRRDAGVSLRIARAFARHGERTRAIAVLGESFPHVRDDATRREFAALYAALRRADEAK